MFLLFDYPLIIFSFFVFLLLALFIVLFVLLFLKRKQQHLYEMTTLRHLHEQTLLTSRLEIQEETLQYVSQEIHDNIGQLLSLAKLQLNTFPLLSPEEGVEIVSQSKDIVSKAITDLRSLSKRLSPDRIAELGLEENIRYELSMLEKTKQYQVNFKINGSPFKLTTQTQTILFRIVQEAISNIIKHASASKIDVCISYELYKVCLTITDNGIGITKENGLSTNTGIGLTNMRQRASVIGANLKISSTESGGTIIEICKPVD